MPDGKGEREARPGTPQAQPEGYVEANRASTPVHLRENVLYVQ